MREKENLLGRESEDGGSSTSSRAVEDSRMGSLDSKRDAGDPEPNIMFGCTLQLESGSRRVTARIPWLCHAMTNVHYQSPI